MNSYIYACFLPLLFGLRADGQIPENLKAYFVTSRMMRHPACKALVDLDVMDHSVEKAFGQYVQTCRCNIVPEGMMNYKCSYSRKENSGNLEDQFNVIRVATTIPTTTTQPPTTTPDLSLFLRPSGPKKIKNKPRRTKPQRKTTPTKPDQESTTTQLYTHRPTDTPRIQDTTRPWWIPEPTTTTARSWHLITPARKSTTKYPWWLYPDTTSPEPHYVQTTITYPWWNPQPTQPLRRTTPYPTIPTTVAWWLRPGTTTTTKRLITTTQSTTLASTTKTTQPSRPNPTIHLTTQPTLSPQDSKPSKPTLTLLKNVLQKHKLNLTCPIDRDFAEPSRIIWYKGPRSTSKLMGMYSTKNNKAKYAFGRNTRFEILSDDYAVIENPVPDDRAIYMCSIAYPSDEDSSPDWKRLIVKDALELKWQTGGTKADDFYIKYKARNNPVWQTTTVPGDQRETTISNIIADDDYSVEVYARVGVPFEDKQLEDVKQILPNSQIVETGTSNELDFTWEFPLRFPLYYSMNFRDAMEPGDSFQTARLSGFTNTATLRNLDREKSYEVQIVPYYSERVGNPIEFVSYVKVTTPSTTRLITRRPTTTTTSPPTTTTTTRRATTTTTTRKPQTRRPRTTHSPMTTRPTTTTATTTTQEFVVLEVGVYEPSGPVMLGHRAYLGCNYEQLGPNPRITWTKFDEESRPKEIYSEIQPAAPGKERITMINQQTLAISNFQMSDTGLYECRVDYPSGSGAAQGRLKAIIPTVLPPRNLHVEVTNPESLEMEWLYPIDHTHLDSYRIIYYPLNDPTNVQEQNTTEEEIMIIGLEQDTRYNVTVYTLRHTIQSEATSKLVKTGTQRALVEASTTTLHCKAPLRGIIFEITWYKIVGNVKVLLFKSLRRSSYTPENPSPYRYMPFSTDDTYMGRLSSVDPLYLTIRNLKLTDEGRYRCVAINGTVEEKDTIDITVTPRALSNKIRDDDDEEGTNPTYIGVQDEDDVPVPIRFTVRAKTRTSATVTWVMPFPDEITHYTVMYWTTINRFGSGTKTLTVAPKYRGSKNIETDITDLVPGTEYQIYIRAWANKRFSDVLKGQYINFASGPSNIEVRRPRPDSDELTVRWQNPEGIDGVRFSFKKQNSTRWVFQNYRSPDATERRFLMPLEPGEKFLIRIEAIKNNIATSTITSYIEPEPNRAAIVETVYPESTRFHETEYNENTVNPVRPDPQLGEAPRPPSNLTLFHLTPNSFRATWEPTPDSNIDNYEVKLSHQESEVYEVVDFGHSFAIFNDLQTFAVYDINIYAVRNGIRSLPLLGTIKLGYPRPRSEVLATAVTPHRAEATEVPPPINLQFSDVTPKRMTVSWGPPVSDVERFKVRYRQSHSDEDWNVFENFEGSIVVLRKLKPGTSYDVSVQSLRSNNLISDTLLGSHATRQLKIKDFLKTTGHAEKSRFISTEVPMPTNLKFSKTAFYRFTITWHQPAHDITRYQVRYREANGNEDWTVITDINNISIKLRKLKIATEYEIGVASLKGGNMMSPYTTGRHNTRGR